MLLALRFICLEVIHVCVLLEQLVLKLLDLSVERLFLFARLVVEPLLVRIHLHAGVQLDAFGLVPLEGTLRHIQILIILFLI